MRRGSFEDTRHGVFALHIHDEDLWMYILFSNGERVDQFNPIPDYWNASLPADERRAWAGSAAVVAQTWPGVAPESIDNYLFEWDLEKRIRTTPMPTTNSPTTIAGK